MVILIVTAKLKVYLRTHFYDQRTVLDATYIRRKYVYNKYTVNPGLLECVPMYCRHTKPSLYIFDKNYKFKRLKHFFLFKIFLMNTVLILH